MLNDTMLLIMVKLSRVRWNAGQI